MFEKGKKIEPIDYSKKDRLIMALLTSLAATFTYFFYGPIDIYTNNKAEIPITFMDVFPMISLAFAVSFIALTAIIFLFKSNLINSITAVIISLFISGLIDNNITNKIVYTSGDASKMSNNDMIVSFAIYIVILFILVFLSTIIRKKWKNVLIFLCVLLFGSNAAATVTNVVSADLFNDKSINCEYVASRKSIDEVSKNENVIVILFDRMDTKYYDNAVKQYPGYFDNMQGFTYYDSATTTYSRTFPAVSSLITNKLYLNDMTADEFFNTAYPESPFLKDLKNNDYTVNLYIDRYYEYNDAVVMKDYVDNVEPVKDYIPRKSDAWKYLTWLSVARNFSFMLSEYSVRNALSGKVSTLSKIVCDSGIYHDNDAEYYKELKANGLKTNNTEKNFTFLYLHGSHAPITLNENCERSQDSTVTSQTVGAFKIVFEYLDQLKKLGVYDNSTIIITADHGYAISDYEDYFKVADSGITACMFVKPKNAKNEKLITSSAEISITNLVPTIVQDAKLKTDYDYGKSVFDIKEGDRQVRTLYQSVIYNGSKLCLNEYEINGDAKDLNNWTLKNRITSNYAIY